MSRRKNFNSLALSYGQGSVTKRVLARHSQFAMNSEVRSLRFAALRSGRRFASIASKFSRLREVEKEKKDLKFQISERKSLDSASSAE